MNYLHQSGLLTSKLSAKEIKRRQHVPWQAKQRPSFSQTSDTSSFGQSRGRGRGRGRGRVVARNHSWVSGGVLTAGDFLGLHGNTSAVQFSTDDDYTQLAESARSFAESAHSFATASQDYHGQTHGAVTPGAVGQPYGQQDQKRAGAAGNSVFTAYGSYVSTTANAQTDSRGRGLAASRGGTQAASKPSTPPAYRQRYTGSGDTTSYGLNVAQPVSADQYTAAYSSLPGHQQQQQQLYEAYPGYDYTETYQQAGYYATGDVSQYLATDNAAAAQYYSQF